MPPLLRKGSPIQTDLKHLSDQRYPIHESEECYVTPFEPERSLCQPSFAPRAMVPSRSDLCLGNLTFGYDLTDQYRSSVGHVAVQFKFDLTVSILGALTVNVSDDEDLWDFVFDAERSRHNNSLI